MQSRRFNLLTYWPLTLICGMIFVVIADIAFGLATAAFPPGLLGAVPVLLCGVFFIVSHNQHRQITLLRTVVLFGIVCFISILAATKVPSSDTTHFLGIVVGLGMTLCAVFYQWSIISNETGPAESFAEESVPAEVIHEKPLATTAALQVQSTGDGFEELEEPHLEGELLQSWTRSKLPDGTERLKGTLVVTFRAGEKIQHCHLPFSPALQGTSQGWCECSDDEIRAEFNVLQSYGARLTVRRSAAQLEEATTEVAFIIETSLITQAAA